MDLRRRGKGGRPVRLSRYATGLTIGPYVYVLTGRVLDGAPASDETLRIRRKRDGVVHADRLNVEIKLDEGLDAKQHDVVSI